MDLKEYKNKRNFGKTNEPKSKIKKSNSRKSNHWVIQKHNASRLHYDLRLEINNVLVSWAIPKEPTKEEGIKRLAVQTEDHPLEYGKFEGTIPKGNYGAGTVKIWDSGKFENIRKNNISMSESLNQGQIEVKLNGKRLNGNFALIKLKPTSQYPGKNNWLFFKMKQ